MRSTFLFWLFSQRLLHPDLYSRQQLQRYFLSGFHKYPLILRPHLSPLPDHHRRPPHRHRHQSYYSPRATEDHTRTFRPEDSDSQALEELDTYLKAPRQFVDLVVRRIEDLVGRIEEVVLGTMDKEVDLLDEGRDLKQSALLVPN
jgi:hypothetical protein